MHYYSELHSNSEKKTPSVYLVLFLVNFPPHFSSTSFETKQNQLSPHFALPSRIIPNSKSLSNRLGSHKQNQTMDSIMISSTACRQLPHLTCAKLYIKNTDGKFVVSEFQANLGGTLIGSAAIRPKMPQSFVGVINKETFFMWLLRLM